MFDFGRLFRLMPDLSPGSVEVHREGSVSSKGSGLAASNPIFVVELMEVSLFDFGRLFTLIPDL